MLSDAALVGIPESLRFFGFSRLWETFLSNAGIQLLYSGPTNKDVIEAGIECAVNEACLPVKMIHGQVKSLIGRVDAVFLPRMVNVSGLTVFCPKFLGMPDMVRSSIALDIPMVSPRVDLRAGPRRVFLSLLRSVKGLCHRGPLWLGAAAFDTFRQLARTRDYDSEKRPDPGVIRLGSETPRTDLSVPLIGVIGYPYLVEDAYASMGLVNKLRAMGVRVTRASDIPESGMSGAGDQFSKQVFWYYSDRMVKAGYRWCETRSVDGIVHLMAFGCGPDAIVDKMVELRAAEKGVPYLTVTVDECTGEAGVITRLEAFVDMLTRTSRDHIGLGGLDYHAESDFSPHGAGCAPHFAPVAGDGERDSFS